MASSSDIVERLMAAAKQVHQDRLCAEFGPGGGNPEAKLEESLEWKAAEEIRRLRQICDEAEDRIDCTCDMCASTKNRLAYVQSFNIHDRPLDRHGRIVI